MSPDVDSSDMMLTELGACACVCIPLTRRLTNAVYLHRRCRCLSGQLVSSPVEMAAKPGAVDQQTEACY